MYDLRNRLTQITINTALAKAIFSLTTVSDSDKSTRNLFNKYGALFGTPEWNPCENQDQLKDIFDFCRIQLKFNLSSGKILNNITHNMDDYSYAFIATDEPVIYDKELIHAVYKRFIYFAIPDQCIIADNTENDDVFVKN